MLSFRDREDTISSSVMIASVALLAATLLYIVLVPKASTKGLSAQFVSKRSFMLKETLKAKSEEKALQAQIARQTFAGATQDVDATILDIVAKSSARHKVKLVGFRPSRGVDASHLTQLPFQVSVDGLSSDVLAFERDIETGGQRLAVNSLQMSASDPSTDQVSANINMVAYLNLPFDEFSAGAVSSGG